MFFSNSNLKFFTFSKITFTSSLFVVVNAIWCDIADTFGVIFVPQPKNPRFCPWKGFETSFENEEGGCRMIWKIFMYYQSYLKCFQKKKNDTSKNWWLGVTRWAKVVQKLVVFARNRCDVFISFWNWKHSWLGIERVCVRALIRRKRINFLVFWKNILSHILHLFCNTLNCPFE